MISRSATADNISVHAACKWSLHHLVLMQGVTDEQFVQIFEVFLINQTYFFSNGSDGDCMSWP